MPMSFPSAVAAPGGMSYAAPLMQFQQFANWAADDPYQKVRDEQAKKLNEQRLAQGQRQEDIANTFKGGLPRDKDGNPDYRAAVAMLAQKGDVSALWNSVDAMNLQQAGKLSPMLAGGGQPGGAPQGQPQVQGAPSAVAPPNSPKGDAGQGTVTSLVTDRLPSQNQTTGATIMKIAETMGIDPNADLTPGQIRRAQGLLNKYAPEIAGGGDTGGRLPPSASSVSPAPPPSQPQPQASPQAQPGAAPQTPAQPSPAPIGAPSQQPPQAGPAPQQAGPIVPQVPLPKGFNDPQAAILALRTEAARIGANPRAGAQVKELNNWADRIEQSIQPVDVNPNTTRLDPRTGQKLYQGPAAAAIEASAHAGSSPTLDADAERYLQSGQLPPNLSKNLMGQAEAKAIRDRATQMAQERGVPVAELPQKWQQFKAQQVAIQRFTSGPQGNTIRSFNVLVDHLDTLSEAATALNNGDNRLLNRFKQNWAANTGGTAPTNFDGVKALVGDEIVKAVVGSAGALADREEVKKDLDRASSPKQLEELVGKYKKLALGQLHGLQKQYETSTGLKNFDNMLLPGTQKALGGKEGKAAEPKVGSMPDKEGWITLPNGARIQEVK